MLDMSPRYAFVHDDVAADPLSMARVERMLPCLKGVEVATGGDAVMNEWVAAQQYPGKLLWGERPEPRDPDLAFIRTRYDAPEEKQRRAEAYPKLRYRNLLGYGGVTWREDGTPEWRERTGTICQPAWQIHSANGCAFRCAYCWFGDLIGLTVNIEEQIAHFDELFERAPKQRIWKWDNQTDINVFEPEWDATKLMIERFAREDERYLLLYTGKSDNVDFMLDLDHQGQTVICWSLSPETQARVLEPRTALAFDRVAAAGKCYDAGYAVRFRFSPIIPVVNWRREYADLIHAIFESCRPDVISLCPFGWMDVPQAERCLDLDVIDPDALAAMRAHGRDEDWQSHHASPIPFAFRREMLAFLIDEIHKYGDETMISLCLESPRMWAALGDRLGQKPTSYFCNCGAHCAPRDLATCT